MAAASVAVVGGGLAGLAAAMELKNRGARVELFERSRLLGGRATSFELDGHVVDNGQHVYLACCTEFIDFVRRAGSGDALYLQDRFEVVAYGKNGVRSTLRAASLPAPFHLIAAFAGYKHLSIAAKAQIARALLSLIVNPRAAREEIGFAQWLRENGQSDETIRGFWDPFMVPALNAPLERTNAAEAAFVLSTAFLSDRNAARFGYSKVPLAQIMEGAAAQLDGVHRANAVFSIDATDERIVLQTASEQRTFDAAVLAVSPRALAKLLPDANALGVPPLDVFEAFAIMDVHLWYDGAALPFEFAAILDSPVQWVFQKAPGYLCCSISAADALVAEPSAQVAALAWAQVRAAIPELRDAQLRSSAATRNPEGTYLAAPGAQRPGPGTRLSNLAIAGAWTLTRWPDTMESAVRSGFAAARVLLKSNLMTREATLV